VGTDKFAENYEKATAYLAAKRHLDFAERSKADAEAAIEEYNAAVDETLARKIAEFESRLIAEAVASGKRIRTADIQAKVAEFTKRKTTVAKRLKTMNANLARREAARRGESSGLVAKGPGIDSTVAEAKRTLEELKGDLPMLEAFEKQYRKFSDFGLDMMVWSGKITAEQAVTIRQRNPYWFAVIRIENQDATLDEVLREHLAPTRGLFAGKNLIYAFQGSQKTKDDIIAALVTRVRDTVHEAHRNYALAQLVDWMEASGYDQGREYELNRVATEAGVKPTEKQFKVWRNGVEETWEASKENQALIKSMAAVNMRSEDMMIQGTIAKLITTPSSVTRNLIINAPPFVVRNLTRDTIHRTTMVTGFENAKDFKGEVPDVAEQMGVGLGRSTVFADPDTWARRSQDAVNSLTGQGGIVLRTKNGYRNLREKAELVNRQAVWDQAFRSYRASGYSEYQAAVLATYAARESMTDFKKIGRVARVMSQIIPFFSAQIAGTRTSAQLMAKNPTKVLSKLMVYSVSLMALEQLWAEIASNLAGDDDEEKELKRLNSLDRYQREMFWNLRIGGDDGFWLSIPKGHEQSIFTTMVGQLGAAVSSKRFGEGDPDRVARSILENLLPVSSFPDAFGGLLPVLELGMNRNTFNGKEIVPFYEKDREMDRRNVEYASPFGRALHGGLGVDARQWDYALEQMTGYYGRAITGALEADSPEALGRVLLRFTGVSMPGNQSQNEDVIAVDNLLRTYGIRPTAWTEMKKKVFDGKTEAERQRAGAQMVARAKVIRQKLEAWKPLPDEARKANARLLFQQ
jgi:hypothetical protein